MMPNGDGAAIVREGGQTRSRLDVVVGYEDNDLETPRQGGDGDADSVAVAKAPTSPSAIPSQQYERQLSPGLRTLMLHCLETGHDKERICLNQHFSR